MAVVTSKWLALDERVELITPPQAARFSRPTGYPSGDEAPIPRAELAHEPAQYRVFLGRPRPLHLAAATAAVVSVSFFSVAVATSFEHHISVVSGGGKECGISLIVFLHRCLFVTLSLSGLAVFFASLCTYLPNCNLFLGESEEFFDFIRQMFRILSLPFL